jgi:hypothetical protein
MNDDQSQRSLTPQFSLLSLLALTAVIAIGTAVGSAYRKNRSLVQQRDELLSLSSRLQVDNPDELASSEIPRVADDFYSWNIHVPNGQEYELRLGAGDISEYGIPPIVSSVRIPAGRHRVTLHSGDSPSEEFRYVVYIDGKQAMEKTMGSDWLPGGWSSASGMSWPREPVLTPAPLQLSARSYRPRLEFGDGPGRYFNGQSDNFVTRRGYRLWIDDPDRTYQPASPFIGFDHDPSYPGIGLRDGLRYRPNGLLPYEWTFTRPSLDSDDPVLRISAEFFASDGTVLSSNTPSFQSWQVRNGAHGEDALSWQADPAQSAYSAFLHAKLESGNSPQPVVEMKWDSSRPDEVALRLADIPANDRLSRWRLRILGGTKHLWRKLQIGDRTIDADKAFEKGVTTPIGDTIALDLGSSETADTLLRWQSNETLPLQIVERTQKNYAGLGLYKGLPVTFGIQIPAAMRPTLNVKLVDEASNASGDAFPGGTVFDEIEIELEAVRHEWIWLQAKPRK